MTAYKPIRDLPSFVREHQTFSPTKLREVILHERNKSVSPESVTMWFKRHPEVYDVLRKEVVVRELSKGEVTEYIFENGAFLNLRQSRNGLRT